MNASVIKQVIFENSLNFERIFKYNKECKSLIARVFIRLPIYYITEKIVNMSTLICIAVQIKNYRFLIEVTCLL